MRSSNCSSNCARWPLHELPVPTVAAVNGVCAGAGVSIALAADSASFVLTFAPRLGLVPDLGASWKLPRLIGWARAQAVTMLGERISADMAERWGMIWRQVPAAALAERRWPWPAGILPGMVICGVIGPMIFWPTFRLRGSFFAIATLAFNEVGMAFANYFEITGGPRGVQVPFKAGLGNMIFANPLSYAFLMFGYMALCLLVASMVRHGRLCYYLLAVRDDQDCARASGIDVARVKLLGMAISAAMTAAGGTLFAMYVRTIDPPTLFSLADVGFKFALLALIGGMGTVMGPVLGAFLIIPLENWLRTLLSSAVPGAHLLVLGILMLLAALFMRKGVGHAVLQLWRRYQRRRGGRDPRDGSK